MQPNEQTADRRLVAVPINNYVLVDMLVQDSVTQMRCKTGVPKDAVYVGCYFDASRLQCMFVFTCPSFDLVAEGEPIPYFPVAYEALPPLE